MVDNFSILLSHVLIALSFWLLMSRDDLDNEPPPAPDEEPEGFVKRRKAAVPPPTEKSTAKPIGGAPHA